MISYTVNIFGQVDTLTKNIPSHHLKDSLKIFLLNETHSEKDLIKKKTSSLKPQKKFVSKFLSVSSHGQVSIGYDYGVIPFSYNMPIPTGYFHADGSMSLKVAAVPFNASFFYSDIKNMPGLNNYFRFVYDKNQLNQDLKDKLIAQQDIFQKQLSSLYTEKQLADQKLHYYKYVQQHPTFNIPDRSLEAPSLNVPIPTIKNPLDSLSAPSLDGTIEDSISLLNKEKHRKDSINAQVEKYQGQVHEYENQIKDLSTKLADLKDPKKLAQNGKTYLTKTAHFFENVRKLEIGMCYPDYSTFLVSGVAVKGVNVEYEKKGFYLAFTFGKTVNNFLVTNNPIQNQLLNVQNLYNFFDFNYVKDSRRVTAIKCGYGKKDGNHLYFGLLYGIGMPAYIYTTTPINTEHGVIPDRNFVSEIDGKYILSEKSTLDLVYGRSSLQTADQDNGTGENGLNSILYSKQSNAAMGKYSLILPKTRTKLAITGRWVDPFFKSFGVGFMRSDNVRGEIKLEQAIGKKFKVSGFYRRDEDNLLSIYNYKTVLQTIGANLTVKIKRSLTVRLGYNPVLLNVDTKDKSYTAHNTNNISNVLVTYVPSLRRGNVLFNLMYNYYYLTTGEQNTTFQNITFSNLTQFKKSFKNNITAGWFSSSGDSLNNRTWLITDELGYTFKKAGTISGGLKGAYNQGAGLQYGYLFKMSYPIIKHLSFELSGEKLVSGDFYNSLNYYEINKFPYYCSGKITINW
jgi:hypothetical protein